MLRASACRADRARITIGTLMVPPDMYRSLAALLMIWSIARKRKSPYWTSTIGRIPMMAAPTAAPKKPSSAIGVLSIRSGNSFSRPSVTVNAPPHPPGTAMSSPRQKTAGSRAHLLGDPLAQRFGNAESFH